MVFSSLRVAWAPARVTSHSCRLQRRTFGTEILTALSQGYIDLALALPVPPSLPPYATTIVIATVASRLTLTVPVAIWAKQRQWRAEELVLPQLQELSRRLKEQIATRFPTPDTKQAKSLQAQYKKRTSEFRKALFKKYKCSPIPTMLLPQLVNLPVFIGGSLILQHACQIPTPLELESVLTLPSLISTDPTAALPIVCGLLTLANVDTSKWLVGGTYARDLLAKQALERKQDRERGVIKIRPQDITKVVLRLFSVLRIVIGMAMPGAVIMYWTSSSAFALMQSWVFDYWEGKRKESIGRRRAAFQKARKAIDHAAKQEPQPKKQLELYWKQ